MSISLVILEHSMDELGQWLSLLKYPLRSFHWGQMEAVDCARQLHLNSRHQDEQGNLEKKDNVLEEWLEELLKKQIKSWMGWWMNGGLDLADRHLGRHVK